MWWLNLYDSAGYRQCRIRIPQPPWWTDDMERFAEFDVEGKDLADVGVDLDRACTLSFTIEHEDVSFVPLRERAEEAMESRGKVMPRPKAGEDF